MKKRAQKLIMASTTSVQQSGLLDILLPAYEQATPYPVAIEVVAVGTGKAIRLAKHGEPICFSCMIPSGKKNSSLRDMALTDVP